MVPDTATAAPVKTDPPINIASFLFFTSTPKCWALSSPKSIAFNSRRFNQSTKEPMIMKGSAIWTYGQPRIDTLIDSVLVIADTAAARTVWRELEQLSGETARLDGESGSFAEMS